MAHSSLGEFVAALKAFQACLALPRPCPEALLNIGVAYWKQRDFENAKETFRQCLGANGVHAVALRCLAAIALQQKDY